jgi:hypothetical protein
MPLSGRSTELVPVASGWWTIALYVALAVATASVGEALSLPPSTSIVLPVTLLAYGLLVLARHQIERAGLRRAADAWIARGYESRTSSYAWRIAELTSPRQRQLLACSLSGVLSDISDRRPAPLSPFNRRALLPNRHLIRRLSNRLDDLDRPISAAGILAVNELLTNPGSALYQHGHDVSTELVETISRLEPRR